MAGAAVGIVTDMVEGIVAAAAGAIEDIVMGMPGIIETEGEKEVTRVAAGDIEEAGMEVATGVEEDTGETLEATIIGTFRLHIRIKV